MLPPRIYSRENIVRIGYAQWATVGLVMLICGYLAARNLLGLQAVWTAERMLRNAKSQASQLSRELSIQQHIEKRFPSLGSGGVDTMAVRLADWAAERKIRVESFVPEGSPSATEITIDGLKLGIWNSNRVRVKGHGSYTELMSFLDELRNPPLPVRLDSFALQSVSADGGSAISFDLVLTVYERKTDGAG
ncbi:MAG: hypothetical protein ACP5R5_10455 [Armatimonadota bacterium]